MTDPISNERLLPCPFCGASGDELMMFCDPLEGRNNSGPSRRIQCACCNIEAPFYDTKAEAIAAWNRRQSPVKPLEWQESNEGYAKGQWFAQSIFGEYCTYMHAPSGRAWLQGPGSLSGFFDTIDDAKAAAQADYERRVLSCLVSHKPASGDTQDVLPSTDEAQEPAGVEHRCGQHVAYFNDGEFHWMSGIAPRNCELYASPPKAVTITDEMVERASRAFAAIAFEAAFEADAESEWHRIASPMRAALTAALSSEAHNGRE